MTRRDPLLRTVDDLCREHPAGPEWSSIERATYKYTDCGAWITRGTAALPRRARRVAFEVRVARSLGGIIATAWRHPRRRWTPIADAPPVLKAYCHDGKLIAGTTFEDAIALHDSRERLVSRSRDGGSIVVRTELEFSPPAPERPCIRVGSIVEGVDVDADTVELVFPFRLSAFWAALKQVEESADYIWQQTHGCEWCGIEGEWGHPAINPECSACQGEGTIL